ncbi:MAG: Ig-like domain-containing protein [Thermoanaerobaculia bacterium]
MGRRQTFLLLLLLFVFASFVSAASVTFLDEWGAPAARVLEQGKALLRVIDPAADTSPGRDSVAVELGSAIALDTDFTTLQETGEATGVFEGEVDLTTDYYLNYLEDESHLLTQLELSPPSSLDTVTATYGSVSGSAEAAQSLTDLLDETGVSPAGIALGETVRVRVRDRYAARRAGRDTAMATLSTTGGDSESLILVETGERTGVFETALPSGAGAPVPGDGRIQAAAGQTVSATHPDRNGFSSSSDSAAFTAASVRFVDAEGQPTDLYLDGSRAIVRAVDLAANTDPYTFQSVSATGSMQLSGDTETFPLRETGPDTGVFEATIDLSVGYPYSGDQRLSSQALTSPVSPFDTVGVSYAGLTDSAGLTGSIVRLLDDDGEEAASFALAATVHIRVEADNDSPFVDSTFVEVRSLTTGDVENLELLETGPATNVFEGSVPVIWSYAGPNDGYLEAEAGETLRVDHADENGYTFSRAEAAVVRSSVRFVDAQGNTEPVLLEMGTARVRVTDLMSSGQPVPPDAEVSARLTNDVEPLSLAAILGSSFVFEGSVPLRDYYYSTPGDGYLATSRSSYPVNQTDTVTATSNGATAEAVTAPAILAFVDGQGEPLAAAAAGSILRVRAVSALANRSPSYANSLLAVIGSYRGEYSQYLVLTETGADTGIFEGTVQTRTGPGSPGPGELRVEPRDSVIVVYDADTSTYDDTRETSAVIEIVPVSLELVDGQGAAVSSYLFGDTVHVRVSESGANASPALAESVLATVQAVRRSDDRPDVETVFLTETGPDTGVFSGALPTALISLGGTPAQGDGVLELLDTYPPYGDLATITATRSGASDTALAEDSRLRLTDAAGEDADFFPIGGQAHVRLQRPAGDTTAGVDTQQVQVWTSSGYASDFEMLTLVETGDDTGIFTGSIPLAYLPFNSGDGILQGGPGAVFRAEKQVTYTIRSADTGKLTGVVSGDPVAVDDFATTAEDTPVTIGVLLNDTDPDGDTLGVIAVTQGAKGSVTFTPAGSTVTYTPNANATGSDSFTYQVSDFSGLGDGNTDTATVFVTITPVNDPPNALDDSATTNEDTGVYVPVLANDVDPDSGTLTITAATQGAKGVTAIQGDGTILYAPNGNANGADSFTYTVSDGSATDTATVAVTITPVNDAPVAWNDLVTTPEDTAITIAILANDTDAEGDPLTAGNVGAVANGTLVLNPDGTLTYTPNPDFRGFENFTYTASDPSGANSTATVHIEVTPVNDPPTAVNDAATTNEDTALNFNVVGNDTDPDGDNLVVSAVTQGAKGSVVINNSPSLNGKYVIYTPTANANGSDSFTYTISDGQGGTSTATVAMTITPVNDVPDAVADSVTTPEDTPVTFNPRTNDTDADGDTLTITSVNGGTRGTPVLNADGTITYTPMANVSGTDFIQYYISDGHGGTDSALVTITTTAVNDAPDARNDLPLTQEDTPITINVLANDTDVEGDTLTVTSVTQPAKGTAVVNANNTITYTPNLNTNGSDSFNYTISDGQGGSDTATVFMSVSTVNDPPVAVADSATVAEEGTVTIAVAANDTDPENSTLTVTAVTQGAHGTVTLLTGNQVRYQPVANYAGPDTFTYTIRDPGNLTSVGTVTVTVTPVNDPPVANADTAATDEDTPVAISVLANDTDVDGDTLTVPAVTQSANGSVTTNGTTVTFTPAANFHGTAGAFTYTVRDAGGVERTASVTVTVASVNDPPVANADSITLQEDSGIAFQPMANDTDVDGDTLTIVAVTQGANGTAGISGAWVSFSPAANFHGGTSFTYTIRDTGGAESTAYVNVSVTSVNDPPMAGPDTAATNKNTPVTVSVLANDADIDGAALSVSAVTQGSNGAVTTNGITVTYTPAAGFTGSDSFTYNVSDGLGGTATGLVSVAVANVNDAPVANPDSGSTREGVPVIIPVLANDTDADGGTLTVTAVGSPGVLLPDGTVRYTPGANFTGTVTFSYTVSDGQGGTATGQVTVTVGEALERVAILATNSVALRTGADVLSGDVIVNQAGAGPFLNGAELSLAGTVTTAANWDVEADSLTVAAGAVVGSDVSYNQLTNNGTINGLQRTPLVLPVFPALPAFLAATPGTANVNVANNGTRTLAPGSYLDLTVGRKATVTFTGGVYHFRSITVDREAKLFFSAASEVRVQQKLGTKTLTTVGPAAGASIDASSILFYVGGINGTTGGLTQTPKAVEIGTSNTVAINLYAPNGTIWLQDGTLATGAFLGRDVDLGIDAQVTLDSAWQ